MTDCRRLARCRALLELLVVVLAAFGPGARAQSGDTLEVDRKVIAYAKQSSELMGNLEYLCDVIGPRLTGSARLQQASDWTAGKMRSYGLDNVRLESWTIPVGWERGRVDARLVTPNAGFQLSMAQRAWTPGTRGAVTGPVVIFDPKPDNSDLDRFRGKLHNAILLMSSPATVNEHPSRETGTSVGPRPRGTDETDSGEAQRRADPKRDAFLKEEGAAAELTDAGKPQMLLNMSGSWGPDDRPSPRPARPVFYVAHEHYAMLYRLLQRGMDVTVRLRADCRFVRGPITVYNTVGEIRGSEKPDEIVLCGGHLDSWDLANGAVDNGTGAMVVLETARLIKALNLKPKRTIRFVLFTGEEEGLHGSRAYVRQHKSELARHSAVFVLDIGTGKVTGIGLHGNGQARPVLEPEIAVLNDLGVTAYSEFLMSGTDHASFYPTVPGFWFMQEGADYNLMHHSQSDTYDKALPDDLTQCATVMAVCAYNVAQLPEMLPRRPDATKAPAAP
jgi:hypothetical protein